jgi:hypothetical protein
VELYELPEIVLARIPELREYRFLVGLVNNKRDRTIARIHDHDLLIGATATSWSAIG